MTSRKLGQHFLINRSAIQKIITALGLQPNDTIIEIGPGEGALTLPLAEECRGVGCKLIAIEKDSALARKLVISNSKLKIINDDALKALPKLLTNYQLPVTNYKIVGNIPYYITGKLLRVLGDQITIYHLPHAYRQAGITNIVLMLQKEVARRIAAKPPQMNLLAAAVQFWAEPKILFSLKSGDFDPPPKVESAVIRLTTYDQRLTTELFNNYYKLLHIIFKQPRKTLLNNLKTGLNLTSKDIELRLKSLKIAPQDRPQNLSIKQIKKLAQSYSPDSFVSGK